MATTKRTRADIRREQLRNEFFGEVAKEELWTSDLWGWCWVPRTMPLVLQAIRMLSKGKSAAETYFALWCHCMSESIVEIKDKGSLIAAAGYNSATGERTWKARMKKLEELGFIKTAPGTDCVLLMNPHKVLKRLKESGKRPELEIGLYNKIRKQMIDYKCRDFKEVAKFPPPPRLSTAGQKS